MKYTFHLNKGKTPIFQPGQHFLQLLVLVSCVSARDDEVI